VSYLGICDLVHDVLQHTPEERKYYFYEPKDFVHWKGSGVTVIDIYI
jgi:hypothetical protein